MKLFACMAAIVVAFIGAALLGECVVAPAVAAISTGVQHAMTAPLDNRGLHE